MHPVLDQVSGREFLDLTTTNNTNLSLSLYIYIHTHTLRGSDEISTIESNINGKNALHMISWLGNIGGGSVSLVLLRQPMDAAMAEKAPMECLVKGKSEPHFFSFITSLSFFFFFLFLLNNTHIEKKLIIHRNTIVLHTPHKEKAALIQTQTTCIETFI